MRKKEPNGFVLIELVTTLVMIGFIGAFVGLFLLTGVNGFLAAKRNAETALKAQLALDRLSLELRQINELVSISGTAITYRSAAPDLTGARRISYDGSAKTILFSPNGGATDFPLLDRVRTFNISKVAADMNQLGGDEIREITIGFEIDEVPRNFFLRIYPRTMIPDPT